VTWISVEERLPPKMTKVLFYCVQEGHLKNIYMGYLCANGWNIYLPYSSFGLRDDMMPVSHWMELPNMPQPDYQKGCPEVGEISFNELCEHENLNMEPVYQCEDCKRYVGMS
jgi:hypothetical protein